MSAETLSHIKANWHKVRIYKSVDTFPIEKVGSEFIRTTDSNLIEGYVLCKNIDQNGSAMPLFTVMPEDHIWGTDMGDSIVFRSQEVHALVERLIVQEAADIACNLGHSTFAIYPNEYSIDPDVYDISRVFEEDPKTALFLGRNEHEAARQVKDQINTEE